MGVVLKVQLKIVIFLFVIVLVIFGFFYADIPSAQAATIIRPPNNLGLVGYWSFDEGRGTQASDMSGNGNDGTLSGSTLPAWVTGRSKHALSFSAAGGVKRVVSSSVAPITSTFTISAWIYPTSYPSERSTIVQGIQPNSYYMSLASNGSLQAYWYGKSNQGYHSSGASTVPLNTWSHVSIVWDTGGPSLYVDGVLKNSFTSTGSGIAGTAINIGAESLSRQFNGSIDEVRIYSRALSETEVQSLYTNTKSTVVGITPVDRYTEGLVGHWTFDGKHTTATTTEDVAGSNGGAIIGATPSSGIIGQAMLFDGLDDYLDLPTGWGQGIDFSEMSGAAWVLTDGNSGVRGLLEGRGSDLHWEINNTAWRVRLSGLNYNTIVAQPSVNEWTHVAYTYNRSSGAFKYFVDGQQVFASTAESGTSSFFTSGNTQIGDSNFGTRRWSGKIDDFRIYNRELSATEVAGLYFATASSKLQSSENSLVTNGLIGYWSFDGNTVSGSTVLDISGNGGSGTIVGGATPTIGKIGQAMEFGGGSSVVNISSVPQITTNAISVSVWFKTNSLGFSQAIVRKNGQSGTNYDYVLRIHETSNMIAWAAGKVAGNISGVEGFVVTPGIWYHVVGVKTDSGNHSLYVNGNLVNTVSRTSGTSSGESLYLGGTGISSINGFVDDVRIYDRALSEAEITQLYSMGQ